MTNKYYAFFDGDGVGNIIEYYLLTGQTENAIGISNSIKKAFETIENMLNKIEDIAILIIGGDDLLIEISTNNFEMDIINEICSIFNNETTLTISCGIGRTIKETIDNLRLAKVSGKNKIIKCE